MANSGGNWITYKGRRIFIGKGKGSSYKTDSDGFHSKKEVEHKKRKIENDIKRNAYANKSEYEQLKKDYDDLDNLSKRINESGNKESKKGMSPEFAKELHEGAKKSLEMERDNLERAKKNGASVEDLSNRTKRVHELELEEQKAEADYNKSKADYELYKKAKENPDSIDPMTENSTDWEGLEKKYGEKYKNEKSESTKNIQKEVNQEKADYAKKKAEEYKNTKDPMFQDVKEQRAKEYEKQADEEISKNSVDDDRETFNRIAKFYGYDKLTNEQIERNLQDAEKKGLYHSKSDIEAMRRYLNNTVIEKDNGSVYAKPGRRWEVLEKDKSAYGKEIYKVRDEKGNIQWKPASDFYDNNSKSNDWVKNAFNQYKKDHPGTNLTIQDFMKRNK